MDKNFLSDLSIVVLSYNRLSELKNNLLDLADYQLTYNFQLIIVDNNSTDGSRDWLEQFSLSYPDVEVILNGSNLGVAGGRNTANAHLRNSLVLRVDDDTRISLDSIFNLRQVMIDDKRIGAASPLIRHPDTGRDQNYFGDSRKSVANYHGACHILRKGIIDDVGGIDEQCNFGGEELDYSIKIRLMGYDVVYLPEILVFHNTIPRRGNEGIWRKRRRVFNSTRMAFKHWPLKMALLFSIRMLLSHMLSASKNFGVGMSFLHLIDYFRGAKSGLNNRQLVSSEVSQFYFDENLVPDFGNIPIWKKLIRVARKKVRSTNVDGC